MALAQRTYPGQIVRHAQLPLVAAGLMAAAVVAAIAIVLVVVLANPAAVSKAGQLGSPEWRQFRAGEREVISSTTGQLGSPEWRQFRAGERGEDAVVDPWLSPSLIEFRRSERDER
jgi:hypothetical protein